MHFFNSMPSTKKPYGGRRRRGWIVCLFACLLVNLSDETPFDCSRNTTVSTGAKESFFDYKTSVVENGK